MPILILQPPSGETETQTVAFTMTEALSGTVGGFLELSQMLTGRVPEAALTLDTYLTGEVRP